MNGQGGAQSGPGIPDPISSLQNLASQGSRNNQMMGMQAPQGGPMAPQQMPQMPNPNMLNIPNQAMVNMQGTMQPRSQMGMGSNAPQMPNQMGPGPIQRQLQGQLGANQMAGPMPNAQMNQMQLQNQLAGQLQGAVGNQMPGQLQGQLQNQLAGSIQGGMNPMNAQMPNQMQNSMQSQMLSQMQQMQQRKTAENMMMNAPNTGFPRNPTPTQFMRQSPPPAAPSPAGLAGGPQMVSSPALAQSPSSQINLIPGQQRSVGMAPSPSSSLNTPGQPNQSPMGLQEEQAYREKVKQLSKYIEPLRRMIARIGNDADRKFQFSTHFECLLTLLFRFWKIRKNEEITWNTIESSTENDASGNFAQVWSRIGKIRFQKRRR